jgi:hypothetical protein
VIAFQISSGENCPVSFKLQKPKTDDGRSESVRKRAGNLGCTFSSCGLAERTIVTAPMVEKTMPVKSRRRKVSWKTSGAIKALHKMATVPNGATIDAGANPSIPASVTVPPQIKACNHNIGSEDRASGRGRLEAKRVNTRDKVAGLANGHENEPRPPKLAPQVQSLVVLLVLIIVLWMRRPVRR